MSKRVRENDVDFSISEITSKKVRGNDQRNYVKKSTWKRRVYFSISEITSKKYVEMTRNFVRIWSSTYRCNIDVESTSILRGVPVRKWNANPLASSSKQDMFITNFNANCNSNLLYLFYILINKIDL